MSIMEKYIGIPYVLHGRDFSGCDCYGIVRLFLLREFNYELPIYSKDYGISSREIAQEIIDTKPLIASEKVDIPHNGDVILFYKYGYPIHMGVYIYKGILHTTLHSGSVFEKNSSPHLKRFPYREFYRVL